MSPEALWLHYSIELSPVLLSTHKSEEALGAAKRDYLEIINPFQRVQIKAEIGRLHWKQVQARNKRSPSTIKQKWRQRETVPYLQVKAGVFETEWRLWFQGSIIKWRRTRMKLNARPCWPSLQLCMPSGWLLRDDHCIKVGQAVWVSKSFQWVGSLRPAQSPCLIASGDRDLEVPILGKGVEKRGDPYCKSEIPVSGVKCNLCSSEFFNYCYSV